MYTIQEKNHFRKELAPIAWLVSSCTAGNGRHFYVKQLLKYTNVDIYGHCMSNKEWPVHPSKQPISFYFFFVSLLHGGLNFNLLATSISYKDGASLTDREVVARYKFYLSIENSNCDEYVTEKIERPYSAGVVPILDGPKDYYRFLATNHSSLRLDDFSSPEQLALRVHQLDKDDAAYMKYLDYRDPANPVDSLLNPKLLETFDVPPGTWGPDDRGARCGICKLAHDMTEGTYQLTTDKVIGADTTCYFKKWGYISWAAEFYWWIIVLVVLGIFAALIVIIVSTKSHRVRRSLLALKHKLTLPRWRRKKMADDHKRTDDYQLLAPQNEH